MFRVYFSVLWLVLVSNVSKFIFNNTTENNTFINNINVKNTQVRDRGRGLHWSVILIKIQVSIQCVLWPATCNETSDN